MNIIQYRYWLQLNYYGIKLFALGQLRNVVHGGKIVQAISDYPEETFDSRAVIV